MDNLDVNAYELHNLRQIVENRIQWQYASSEVNYKQFLSLKQALVTAVLSLHWLFTSLTRDS